MKKYLLIIVAIFLGMQAMAQERPEIKYDGKSLSIGTGKAWGDPISINGYKGLHWEYWGKTFTIRPQSDGVWIWTSAPSIDFYDTLSGNYNIIRCSGFYVISDGGIKEDIKPMANTLKLFSKTDNTSSAPQKVTSASAQKNSAYTDPVLELIMKEYPELVETGRNGEVLVNYVELVPILVSALQELQNTAAEQREQIAKIKLNL